MAEMKPSGTEWLGEIPEGWKIDRIGDFYSMRNEKVSDEDFMPLSVTMQGIVPQLATAAKSDDHNNRKLVRKGDFAINSRSDRRGSCGISPYDGSVSLINTILAPKGEMDPSYYNWLFHTEQFADEFYKWGHGIVDDLWTTRWQEMKNILIVSPPITEQRAIASYLDIRCSKIDEIIEEARKSIDEYKELKQAVIYEAVTKGLNKKAEMKESGVEWIGDIPSEWSLRKIKYVTEFNPSTSIDYDETAPVGYVPMNSVKNGFMLPLTANYSSLSTGLTKFQTDDIVMAKVTPCFENGNIAIARDLAQDIGFGSSELFVFRTTDIKREFLLYYLQNDGFKNAAAATMTGTGGLKRVSPYFVANAYVTFPSADEQAEIVEYLDKVVTNMNELISEKQTLIEDLVSYKKSLIYELVTGKRKVV